MSLLAAAPGPFLAEARLCRPELGALLPRLPCPSPGPHGCTLGPALRPCVLDWGRKSPGGGVFLLETSPSAAWVGADALPCVGAGFWLTRLCRHIPGKQLLALMPSRELCSPGDWWQHHQGGTEPCCWLSSLRLVMELLRPPFSILRISLAPRSERSHRSV